MSTVRAPSRRTLGGLLVSVAVVVAVSGVVDLLHGHVPTASLGVLYVLAILPVSVIWGLGFGLLVSALSAAAFDFLLIPPRYGFTVDAAGEWVGLAVFLTTAVVVSQLAARTRQEAAEASRLATEQAALRRVATLVAQAPTPSEVFETVTREVGLLSGADLARMERYEPDGTVTGVAGWNREAGDQLAVGTRFELEGASIAALVRDANGPVRVDSFARASGPIAIEARKLGIRSSVGGPIAVGGRLWGVIAASSKRDTPFPAGTESQMAEFTELVATAIANAEAREELRRVADEQAALRRMATLVARAAPPPTVFAAVAAEVGRLLSADQTFLSRYDADDTFTLVAAWSATGDAMPFGVRLRIDEGTITKLVRDTGRPARIERIAESGGANPTAAMLGVRSAVAAPITVEGRLWGTIAVGSTGHEPPAPGTEERLGGFAELVATAIAKAESQAELRASRARIVATADETRRNIERDLHDGIQQGLITIGIGLQNVQAAPRADQPNLLADVEVELRSVLDELREISRGVHPAILSQGGLGAAIKALARRSAVPVELDVEALERLPGPVEVAAYYVVSEGLANAAKHSEASVVQVSLGVRDGSLHLSVVDDGVGGVDPTRGSGIVGLTDRVEALGGTLVVASPPNGGTSIVLELPVGID